MTKAVQFRRGTTSEHLVFTGLEGEVTVDTDKETAVVHNGATAGGYPLAREDLANVSLTQFESKGLAKDDLTNVDQADIAARGIAKNDMTNVTQASVTALGIAKDDLSNVTADASETAKGLVEFADSVETLTGTDTTRATHPAGVKAAILNYITLPQMYISGLNISNAADTDYDITISTGECRSFDDSVDMRLTSSITKRIDAAWDTGTDAGGFPSSITLSTSTWYHVFLIAKPDGTVDAGFDTSLTASNLLDSSNAGGAGFTKYRRVGSILTNVISSTISQFYSRNIEGGGLIVYHDQPYIDVEDGATGTLPKTPTISTPLGIITTAILRGRMLESTSNFTYGIISSVNIADKVPTAINSQMLSTDNKATNLQDMHVDTNTSSQIRYRLSNDAKLAITVVGFIDARVS